MAAMFTIALAASSVRAQAPNQQDSQSAEAAVALEDLPWQVRMGLRALRVERAAPVVDQVVLVPDGATYLDEIARWGPAGRWPVLFEDDVYAGMFIRGFEPKTVVRRASVVEDEPTGEALKQAIERTVVAAWGGDAGIESPTDVFARAKHVPAGIIVADPDDSAWTAAAALAAGRGQPIVWLEAGYRRPNAVLDAEQAEQLRSEIARLARMTGYRALGEGDDIDAITICRMMAGRADHQSGTAGVPSGGDGPIATTDLIGRNGDGKRWAVCGWIFGSEARSAYVAMCGLFLEEDRAKLVNTYGAGGGFGSYGIAGAAATLEERGFAVQFADGRDAGLTPWLINLASGWTTDLAFVNTSGNVDFFNTPNGRGTMLDVPILNTPCAVHFIHSWSFKAPTHTGTIGGRWLDAGAYAYVGSVHEPYLSAFVPPEEVVKRMVSGTPLLVAARHYGGPMGARPWRVATYGDPLMTCMGPDSGLPPAQRIDSTRQWTAGDASLKSEAARRLRMWAEDHSNGDALAGAIQILAMLGEDKDVADLFRAAANDARAAGVGVDAAVARAALGSLFRRADRENFLIAWRSAGLADDRSRTMLWHLMGPALGPGLDEDAVIQLQANLREPRVDIDLRRLRPALERALGGEYVKKLIARLIGEAQDKKARSELEKMR